MARTRRLPNESASVGAAVLQFVSSPALAASSRRSYRLTLLRLAAALDPGRPVSTVSEAQLRGEMESVFAGVGPATWNRHAATVRSFLRWAEQRGLLAAGRTAPLTAGLARRREPADRTRAIAYSELDRLWRRPDVAVREKALWRFLYETAGRASEVLSLNVEDLDLDNRRAVVVSKGGDTELLHFQTGSARLLPRLIAGRRQGPVFLTERRPAPGRLPALVDLDQVSGLARLSYRRAEEIFGQASQGWTLHQLRHSAITHLAEANVGLPLLMAKSRHTSLRSLQRYARPGVEAVAAMTAAHDPDARTRRRGTRAD